MAGSVGNWTENKFLEHLVGKTSWTKPTAYVALMTAHPGEAGTGGAGISEVANANGYARVATAGGDWENASGGAIQNANAITFNQATGSWGTVTYWALMSSPVWGEGFMMAYGDLTTPKTIDNGDTAEFAAGELDINCD